MNNNIYLTKMLILDMLSIDDEPLNLILAEARVSENNEKNIKPSFINKKIRVDDVKIALKELIEGNQVVLLNEGGNKLVIDDISKALNSTEEWVYWFRIADIGRDFFEENYDKVFIENNNA